MKILFIDNGIHIKNRNALFKYNIEILSTYNSDISLFNLNEFDAVYSAISPIDVKKYPNTKFIFGPHFSVFPDENQMKMIEGNNSIYILPSEWPIKYWLFYPFCENVRFESIPFGVDTDKFCPSNKIDDRKEVFIYFKRRMPEELSAIYTFLINNNYNPKIFNYVSKYSEHEYIDFLKKSKFGIWIDAHESQGFALQEALSCDVPLLVWNIRTMDQEYGSNYEAIPATTIPYWDDRCGEYFYNVEELNDVFFKFTNNLDNYKPREFVCENLSIDVCSNKFIDLINKIKY